METLNNIVLTIQHYLADYILIVALLGGGIWFSVKLGFIQIRGFGEGMRRTFGGLFSKKGAAGADGMSSFQALATAIAAQVGTGNIAGAATAIAIGGPGAIFWMWIAAFLGMATIFGEAVMAQKYKQMGADGEITGGPVYYIRAAFTGTFGKILAGLFAVLHFRIRFHGQCGSGELYRSSVQHRVWCSADCYGRYPCSSGIVRIHGRHAAYRKGYRDHRSDYGSFIHRWRAYRYLL